MYVQSGWGPIRLVRIGVVVTVVFLAACSGSAHARKVVPSTSGADESTTTSLAATVPSTTAAPVSTTRSAVAPVTTAPAASPAVATTKLAGAVILIDAGHNGGNAAHASEINRSVDAGNGVTRTCDTTGTASNDGWPEYAFTMALSNLVATRLRTAGATVVMTRADSSGWGPCITERAAIGNLARANLGLSIHADGNTSASARGFHVITPQVAAGGVNTVANASRFGTLLRDRMQTTGMPPSTYIGRSGLIARGDLGGLNLSTIPKVFVECGNMRNPVDLALLRDPGWQSRAADAIVAAMAEYLAGG